MEIKTRISNDLLLMLGDVLHRLHIAEIVDLNDSDETRELFESDAARNAIDDHINAYRIGRADGILTTIANAFHAEPASVLAAAVRSLAIDLVRRGVSDDTSQVPAESSHRKSQTA